MVEGPKKIVITRPFEQSMAFIRQLHSQTIIGQKKCPINLSFEEFLKRHFLIAPVLDVIPLPITLPPAHDIGALIFTSANVLTDQVLKVIDRDEYKNLPLFVVGESVANKLKSLGFEKLEICAQDVDNFLGLFGSFYEKIEKPFLYLRGEDVSRDLTSELGEGRVLERVCYRAIAQPTLPEELVRALRNDELSSVVFFSSRSARIFIDLVKSYGLVEGLASVRALCMSEGVLECTHTYFESCPYVSESPDLVGMLNLVQDEIIKCIVKL